MPDTGAHLERVASVPLLAGLSRHVLVEVARDLVTRRYRSGEVIYHVGDPADALFIVDTGFVKIGVPSETGREAFLAMCGPGEYFGELALLDGAPRPSTAQTMEPTRALLLGRDRFRGLLAEPSVRDTLFVGMATQLRRLTAQLEEMHFLDVEGRLAARLAFLVAAVGDAQGDGSLRLHVSLSQGDLAAMVGCTRQSVNKLLGQFAEDGVVRLDRDQIVVTDPGRLAVMARR